MILWASITAATFNLVCNVEVPDVHGDTTGAEIIFRVDLRARRYCVANCEDTYSIQSFNKSRVVFEDARGVNGKRRIRIVSRKNGAYYFSISDGNRTMKSEGRCVSAEFTGLSSGKAQ